MPYGFARAALGSSSACDSIPTSTEPTAPSRPRAASATATRCWPSSGASRTGVAWRPPGPTDRSSAHLRTGPRAEPPPTRTGRLALHSPSREVEVEQRSRDRHVRKQQRVDERADQVDGDEREVREDQEEPEHRAHRRVQHRQEARDEQGAQPVVPHEPRAAAHRLPDRLVLEDDLLLDELPLDELPDRKRDADDRDEH